MYSIYDLDTVSVVARGQNFPRAGVSEAARRNPTDLIPNCPPDLKGPNGERYGWILEVVTRQPLGAGQVHGAQEYAPPDLEAGTVAVTVLARDRTAQEQAQNIAAQATALAVQAREKAAELIATGFTYEIPGSGTAYSYAIDDRTQNHMLAIQTDLSNGGSGPIDGVWPDMTDTDRAFTDVQWEAFARAARNYKEAILRNLRLLLRDIEAASNQGAINQIDIEDGTGRNNPTAGVNASGWPANGS